MEKVFVQFHLEGERFRVINTMYVPRIGDEVRFSDVCYKVDLVVWCYDEQFGNKANIGLSLIKEGE